MRKRKVHLLELDRFLTMSAFTACGAFAGLIQDNAHNEIMIQNNLSFTLGLPETVTCKNCLKTNKWKQAMAERFINKMTG